MDGVAVMRALLIGEESLIAFIPATNIRAGTVPADLFPAIGIREVSRNETDTVSRDQANVMVEARIQITVYTEDYISLKQILLAARLSPGVHTGVIAGATVRSVLRESVGPDLSDDEAGIFEQSRDFKVTYITPN